MNAKCIHIVNTGSNLQCSVMVAEVDEWVVNVWVEGASIDCHNGDVITGSMLKFAYKKNTKYK